jgi:tRNA G46 methylase TrmB
MRADAAAPLRSALALSALLAVGVASCSTARHGARAAAFAPRAAVAMREPPSSAQALPAGYVIEQPAALEQATAVARKHALELNVYLSCAPIPEHTRAAFVAAAAWVGAHGGGAERPLLLDSGCGTGRSTRQLAAERPECLVLGIDRSLNRLARGANAHRTVATRPQLRRVVDDDAGELVCAVGANALLVRADLPAFWRLCDEAGWRLEGHRLLFPNPSPKAAQLCRRWHGHPSFPLLLRLGGEIELRSNWRGYLEEMLAATHALAALAAEGDEPACVAAARAARASPAVASYAPRAPFASHATSEFEQKYAEAGLPLYRLTLDARGR